MEIANETVPESSMRENGIDVRNLSIEILTIPEFLIKKIRRPPYRDNVVINTIGELADHSESQILRWQMFGRGRLELLQKALGEWGLEFSKTKKSYPTDDWWI